MAAPVPDAGTLLLLGVDLALLRVRFDRDCRENPGSDFVPMYVTGHETVVSWACRGTDPAVTNVGAVDAQGYAKAFWEQVAP